MIQVAFIIQLSFVFNRQHLIIETAGSFEKNYFETITLTEFTTQIVILKGICVTK